MDYTQAIVTLKQADPTLAEMIDRVGDCKLDQDQQTGDLFNCLVRSILHQQLSGKAAAAIHRRFLLLYPELPQPQDVLNTPDDRLREAGISRTKVVYLKDLAQKVEADLPPLNELTELPDETIIELLTPVKGIGRWTVQMLLIFRLHRWDVLPCDDLGIRTAIQRAYRLADPPTRKQVQQIGEVWQPYRTIASWYLWRSLDLK
ncbi:MAG TPA: DNA-3-methyladenine glycosylase [Trichocoleus sp.]|jgi:DNA-3-methyladenine glycosylase II